MRAAPASQSCPRRGSGKRALRMPPRRGDLVVRVEHLGCLLPVRRGRGRLGHDHRGRHRAGLRAEGVHRQEGVVTERSSVPRHTVVLLHDFVCGGERLVGVLERGLLHERGAVLGELELGEAILVHVVLRGARGPHTRRHLEHGGVFFVGLLHVV